MRNVNKILKIFIFFQFSLLLCFCGKKKDLKNHNSFERINFNSDSTFYKFEFLDGTKSDFLLVKNLFLGEKNYGSFEPKNLKRITEYIEANNIHQQPFLRYFVKVKRGDHFVTLWTIKENYKYDSYIQLSVGSQSFGNKYYGQFQNYLKIIRRDNASLSCRCLNFVNIDKSWKLLSKEEIITEQNRNRPRGYCFDTIDKSINVELDDEIVPNEIDFDRAFSNVKSSHWHCCD